MKTIFVTLIFIPLLFSCSGESENKLQNEKQQDTELNDQEENVSHESHENLKDNFVHQELSILDTVYIVPVESQESFISLLNSYFILSNDLYSEKFQQINDDVLALENSLSKIESEFLTGNEKSTWDQHSTLLTEKFKEMKHIESMDEKKSYFSHITETLYCTLKSFNFYPDSIYVNYCPMALDGNGAYWISDKNEINNPYFGSEMPHCGELKETIYYGH